MKTIHDQTENYQILKVVPPNNGRVNMSKYASITDRIMLSDPDTWMCVLVQKSHDVRNMAAAIRYFCKRNGLKAKTRFVRDDERNYLYIKTEQV